MPSRKPPLRVALLLDTQVWAGTESYVLSLARALDALPIKDGERGVKVSVATPRDSILWKRAREANLATFPIGRRGQWDPSTMLILSRRLRRRELDVIHVHNGRTALWGTLAVRLAGRGACVVTQHFITPAHVSARGLSGLLQNVVHARIEENISHHIAISHNVAAALFQRSGMAPDLVSVVHNGIEVPESPADSSQLPDNLRGDVVCVARLQKEKDIPTLIEALQILNSGREKSRWVRCIVAGSGDQHEDLEKLIKAKSASNVFLAGWTTQAAAILSAAKVSVLPSLAEPFGLAVLEAMAQRKPVVAVNSGGPAEIVADGETGLLVPPRDSVAMAAAIELLVDSPDNARTMGEAGFARLRTCFSAERMARETLDVYQKVA